MHLARQNVSIIKVNGHVHSERFKRQLDLATQRILALNNLLLMYVLKHKNDRILNFVCCYVSLSNKSLFHDVIVLIKLPYLKLFVAPDF